MAKIAFLGDSLTWGGYGGNFVDVVREQLPEHDIINAGVGGDTVVNLLRRIDEVLEKHQPDTVFVMVGGNDATSYSMPKTRGYYKKAKQLEEGYVDPETFESTYDDLLHHLQLNFVQALVGVAPTEYSRELIDIRKQYNQITRNVADRLSIPVLDLETPFTPETPVERPPVDIGFIVQIGDRGSSGWSDFESERDKWGYTYTFDGTHLMPDTAKLFADRIVPFIKEHVS